MKKVFALLIAAVMFVSVFPLCASAANKVTITVESVSGKKGEIVEIPVTISENSYLVNADMHVTYDTTKLKLVPYYADPDGDEGDKICYSTENTVLGNGWMYLGNEKTPGDFLFVAATGSVNGITAGGELFRLAFEILADDGNIAVKFSADPIRANDGTGDIGADGHPVDTAMDLNIVSGNVAVEKDGVAGDVTGEGILNMMDIMLLYKGAAGQASLSDAQKAAGDMTGDGIVNMMDVMAAYNRVSGK